MDLNNKPIITDYKCLIRNDYLQEMNDKILNRRFPDTELQPNLDSRPISTKYSLFPIIETMKPQLNKQYLEHYTELNFAPCTSNGPVKKCETHISLENELRGQNTKHYKGDLVNKYIPSLKSDLYSVQLPQVPMVTQPHPLLFQKNKYETSSQNAVVNSNVGKEIINNHTRTQRRNM